MNPQIQELKADVAEEIAAGSIKLKSYVKTIEALLEGAEADAKSHWMYYAIVAFVAAVIGHYV